MVLATSDTSGQPWITPVYFAFDDTQGVFYWYSRVEARHSRLIAANERAAVTIFTTTPGAIGAVYMSGAAREVTAARLPSALSVYTRREKSGDLAAQKQFIAQVGDFAGSAPLRMYSFTPGELYVLNDSIKWHDKWLDTRSEDIIHSIIPGYP